ncbi:hypothetical protein LOK49_Contig8G00016 [Camellia lanceoleosa]|nr:hypothetical protein LOK49_Contig8G00016 [Camellia lanceoleosa]
MENKPVKVTAEIIRSPGLSGQKSLPYAKAVPFSFRKPRSAIRPSGFHNGKENNAPKNGFDVTPIGPTGQRNIQVITKVEAVCKVCFKGLEVGRAIKSECTCTKNAFAHEKCAPTWSSRQQGHICEMKMAFLIDKAMTLWFSNVAITYVFPVSAILLGKEPLANDVILFLVSFEFS